MKTSQTESAELIASVAFSLIMGEEYLASRKIATFVQENYKWGLFQNKIPISVDRVHLFVQTFLVWGVASAYKDGRITNIPENDAAKMSEMLLRLHKQFLEGDSSKESRSVSDRQMIEAALDHSEKKGIVDPLPIYEEALFGLLGLKRNASSKAMRENLFYECLGLLMAGICEKLSKTTNFRQLQLELHKSADLRHKGLIIDSRLITPFVAALHKELVNFLEIQDRSKNWIISLLYVDAVVHYIIDIHISKLEGIDLETAFKLINFIYEWHDHASGGLNIGVARKELAAAVKGAGNLAPIYTFIGTELSKVLDGKSSVANGINTLVNSHMDKFRENISKELSAILFGSTYDGKIKAA